MQECNSDTPDPGGISSITDPTAPVYTAPTPQFTDWTGGYVGLGYSMYSGDLDYSNPGGGSFDLDDSNGANIFGGYLFQSGNIVYGGELASDSPVRGARR